MVYMGSKSRIAKDIVPIIQSYIDNNNIKKYIEPFVGGANVIDKIKCDRKFGCDINKYLIALLEYVKNSSNLLPKEVSEYEYKKIMQDKDSYDDWYVGFVGLLCSFGSKFFGGYARGKNSKGESRNYAMENYKNLNKQAPNLKNIVFKNCKFQDIKNNISGYVIYCDPPYCGTTKYKTEEFPYDEFYDWCRMMSKNNIVLISEYNMPRDFKCIWSKETLANFDSNRTKEDNDDKNKRVEKLFTL